MTRSTAPPRVDRPIATRRASVLRSAGVQAKALSGYRRARVVFAVSTIVPLVATAPQQLQATYPVADAVTNAWVWYLRLCLAALPVIIAATLAGQHERGLRRQRVLDGEPELHQIGAAAVVYAAVAVLGGLVVLGLEAAIAGINNAIATTSGYATSIAFADLVTASLLTVVVVISVGVVVAALTGRAASAGLFALVAGVLGLVLVPVTDLFPQVRYLVAALPSGVLTLIGKQSFGTSNGTDVDVASVAAFAWPAAAIVAVLWSTTRAPRAQLSESRSRFVVARQAAVVMLGVALVMLGYVVPVALRDQIPWQYRPTWLADKAAHRTSVDVTETFVAEVRNGHLKEADRLTRSGDAAALLGPYRRAAERGEVSVLQLSDTERLEPGAVPVQVPGNQITMCLTRERGNWIITKLSTAGSCPAATSR